MIHDHAHTVGGSIYLTGFVWSVAATLLCAVVYMIFARKIDGEVVFKICFSGIVAAFGWPLVLLAPPAALAWSLRRGVQRVRAKTPSGRKLSYDELLARNAELEDQLGVGA